MYMPAWTTSLLRELAPIPMWSSLSTTITSRPLHAKARATASTMTPAPMTRHSTESIRPAFNQRRQRWSTIMSTEHGLSSVTSERQVEAIDRLHGLTTRSSALMNGKSNRLTSTSPN